MELNTFDSQVYRAWSCTEVASCWSCAGRACSCCCQGDGWSASSVHQLETLRLCPSWGIQGDPRFWVSLPVPIAVLFTLKIGLKYANTRSWDHECTYLQGGQNTHWSLKICKINRNFLNFLLKPTRKCRYPRSNNAMSTSALFMYFITILY